MKSKEKEKQDMEEYIEIGRNKEKDKIQGSGKEHTMCQINKGNQDLRGIEKRKGCRKTGQVRKTM